MIPSVSLTQSQDLEKEVFHKAKDTPAWVGHGPAGLAGCTTAPGALGLRFLC